MAKERSPNYPQVPLDVAVQSVNALFRKESRTAVAPEVAVKAWGYSGLNGPSRSRLAALRQYGLIETDKGGKVKVTNRAVALAMRSPGSPEYAAAIRDAALTPTIFRELYETHRDASDEALKYHLVAERKFSQDGAKRLIQAFRSTMDLANLSSKSYDDVQDEGEDEENGVNGEQNQGYKGVDPEGKSSIAGQYRWPLPGGITAEVTLKGAAVTPKALEWLRKYLELAEDALKEEDGSGRGNGHVATSPVQTSTEHAQQL